MASARCLKDRSGRSSLEPLVFELSSLASPGGAGKPGGTSKSSMKRGSPSGALAFVTFVSFVTHCAMATTVVPRRTCIGTPSAMSPTKSAIV